MRRKYSDGKDNYSGIQSEIRKTLFSYAMAKARNWLLKQMLDRNIVTRDILSFVRKQAGMRSEIKTIDSSTVKVAMKAKLIDIRLNMTRLLTKLKSQKLTLLEQLGGKTFKLRKILAREKVNPKKLEEKKIETFRTKLNHYEKKQMDLRFTTIQKQKTSGNQVPDNLKEYKDLVIFRNSNELPKKNAPLGPCIYNKEIKISKDELKILSKQPKFSIMGDVARTEMLLETEKMLGKHRFNENSKSSNKDSVTTARIDSDTLKSPSNGLLARGGDNIGPSTGLPARGGNNMGATRNNVETERQQNLWKVWQENENRFIYHPLKEKIDFRCVRPTDYTLNKRINLPKPLKVENELECEIRKREYMQTFDNYVLNQSPKQIDNNTKITAQP